MAVYRDPLIPFYSYMIFRNLFILDFFNLSPFVGCWGNFQSFVITNILQMQWVLCLPLTCLCTFKIWGCWVKGKCTSNFGRFFQILLCEGYTSCNSMSNFWEHTSSWWGLTCFLFCFALLFPGCVILAKPGIPFGRWFSTCKLWVPFSDRRGVKCKTFKR